MSINSNTANGEIENKSSRVRITVAYDGTDYAGWQLQPDEPTVQGELEKALEKIMVHQIRVTGAGRTDAGVHATGQVAHFDNPGRLEPPVLMRALNALLPGSIRVLDARQTQDDFSARYSAGWKIYRYGLASPELPEAVLLARTHWIRKLPEYQELLRRCSEIIAGVHDFFTFSKQEGHRPHHNCHVFEADWNDEGEKLYFTVKGDRFLRGTVRMLVGGMLAVADGRAGIDDFRNALDKPGRWKEAVPAPACGLTLVRVNYDD